MSIVVAADGAADGTGTHMEKAERRRTVEVEVEVDAEAVVVEYTWLRVAGRRVL